MLIEDSVVYTLSKQELAMSHEEMPHERVPQEFFTQNTSEEVLQAAWADPIDPNTIDFSVRPSCFGEIEVDAFGRGINPCATDGMGENRGDLGSWRVNYAADPVVVALGADGKRRVLLIKRAETRQWALPGGMVEPGEPASRTAKRELFEETGVDLGQVPSRTIYEGYVDDPRNTKHAWIETTAALMIVHYTPEPRADMRETVDAQWFEFEDIDSLEAQTGQLYANHGEMLLHAIAAIDSFNTLIRSAQDLHGRGQFAQAQEKWLAASDILPDSLSKARALRGYAASIARLGNRELAIAQIRTAKAQNDQALAIAPESSEFIYRRERAQSALVLGSLVVGEIVDLERRKIAKPHDARRAAATGLADLDSALADIEQVEAQTGGVDQYRINILSRLAVAQALYGDRNAARAAAKEAARLGWQSESKRLPTSAKISTANALRAKARAVPRGYAARLVARLATPGKSVRRAAALAIANNKFIGL